MSKFDLDITDTDWRQVGAEILSVGVAGEQLDFSVALSSDGSSVAVGARYNTGNGLNAGHKELRC